ncbi:hypothetical protein EKM05_13750 [Flavobacterium sp. GSP27]|uniref:Beta-carotene 15,15'-monooxygenase n=1 Tax=Flavobacterium bomense TaxID=2497483 RepID=A0A432CQF2_9FLAO|nr:MULTISPECIES: hypothetical protein [Flavobacterium]RTY72958.1 hypothetical protein EKL96_13570 [Flavobacterium sp. LS1R10]RTY93329.1 hypothetical protein EKM01_04320 [Flavobacterium sp. RSP46]RTZ05283.1 hypothetical protein EKM05_13750 [Flavobacterium sp. GSP27]RTZ06615.1 hypothetical protein EKL98_05090 [Flavobacterium bomense]
MKELDLLKKDWQKNDNSFAQVSETEIYKMIHRKSSSIVKWIFIISIIEFIVLNTLSFLLPDDKISKSESIEIFITVLDYLSYSVALFFMYLFYKNYRSISVTSNTKKLMECILNTRKTVRYYIGYNLLLVFFVAVLLLSYEIQIKSATTNDDGVRIFFTCIIMLLFILILVGMVWLFYQLIYGILLKKLNRNYAELKKIDL